MDEQIDDLENEAEETEEGAAISLPFHLPTMILGIWKRRNIVIYSMAFIIIFGVIFAKATRTRIYKAHVMLLFDPPPVEEVDAESQLSIYTLIDLIKTAETIDIARTKINLSERIKTIASAIDIELRPKTTLLEISTEWPDAQIAADLANSVYESFFECLGDMQSEKRTKELEDLQSRLKDVKSELKVRDQELKDFTLENKIVDLEKEALAYLQQLVTLDTDYDREVSRLESVRKQEEALELIIEELRIKDREESQAMAAQSSSVTEANVKVQRLRERISESQTSRAKEADLAVRTEQLNRAKTLRKLDAISQSEYEQVESEYKRAVAMSTDTEEITAWKEEIKKLDQSIVPQQGAPSTASAALMQGLILKTIDLQLESTAAAESVKALDEARVRAQTRLNVIPQVKQAYAERLRRVEELANDRKVLQGMSALLSRQLRSSKIPFRVVSRAEPAIFHSSSNTKLIFIGIFMLGGMVVGTLVLSMELHDFTIKSRGSLGAAIPVPLLAALPHKDDPRHLLPGIDQPEDHAAIYRRYMLELKRELPEQKCCVIMVTGAAAEVGTTTVALNLAAGLQDDQSPVLLIDGHTSRQEGRPCTRIISDFVTGSESPLGLGHYLTSPSITEDQIIHPLPLADSQAIVCSEDMPIPALLKATRLNGLIDHMRERFSYIVIDAPALDKGIDTEYLAQFADAALYVVKSGKMNIFKEKKMFKKLEETNVTVVGAVVTDVQKLYERV